jgi:hypothetical protein
MKTETKSQAKTYLPPNAAEIAQAAPIAVSGVVGAPFWEEFSARLNQAPEPKITPRKLQK